MRTNRLFLLLYLLSGAAALLYEVVWLRLLTLSMGHTAAAVGIILAAFMGGLAIGAWLGGRTAPFLAPDRALETYAGLEVTIAACAVLLPFALSAGGSVLGWAYQNGEGAGLFDLSRAVLALVLLFVPTAAMGATYPIAVRWFVLHSESAAARAGGLYAANTIGAAVGAALSGFVLLPLLGLRGTTMVGVALNGTAALGALWLAGRTRATATVTDAAAPVAAGPPRSALRKARTPNPVRDSTTPPAPQMGLAAGALAISGFVALIYEVTWTRILAMVLGPTTYAFSAMLVAFIAGLAIGSTMAALLVRRTRQYGVWLGIVLVASATAALVACGRVDRLPLTIAAAVGRSDVRFTSVLALQVAFIVAIQLPMTIALGAAFPLAIALAAPEPEDRGVGAPGLSDDRMPRTVATIYASNTVGAIAGALSGSFLLIPALGLQTTIRVAAELAVLTGLVVWWPNVSRRASRIAAALTAAWATALALFMMPWNRELLSNGAYRLAPSLAASDVETGLEAGRLLYYREGAAATVSVRQLPGVTSLAIDGKVDASNAEDMLTQKLLAHLPLLLHANPRKLAIVGLGSGVTLGAALRHPIDRADVVEISPEVVAASQLFARENHQALADRRTRLILGDGRSHLLMSADRYDVIISEPSNPWMAGVATLFTREFFMAVRDRLAPGGILCQWAHTYNISDDDLRSIVATFLAAFPEGSAWLVGESDLLLIGSTAPVAALTRGLADSWSRPEVAADLAEVSVRDPFSLLTLFIARGADLRRYAGGALIQSDDRLALEYSAPRAVYGRFQRANVERLREVARLAERPAALIQAVASATAANWRDRGLMQLQADAAALAYDDLRTAVASAPRDIVALDGFARAASRAGRLGEAEIFLSDLAAKSDSVPALVELSTVLAARGRLGEAAQAAQRAASREPGNASAIEQLASIYADEGNVTALEQVARTAGPAAADRPTALYCQMRLLYLRGDFERAAQLGEQLVAVRGANASALNLLGSIYASLGENDRARRAFEASLRIAPRDAAVLVNLGTIELRSANAAAAADYFSDALFLYPTLAPALDGLATSFEQQGRADRARAIRKIAAAH